jgi:hypothetical protein
VVGPTEPAAITAATLLATKALEGFAGQVGETTWAGMSRLMDLASAFHEGVGGGRVGGFGSRGRRPGTVGGWSG